MSKGKKWTKAEDEILAQGIEERPPTRISPKPLAAQRRPFR